MRNGVGIGWLSKAYSGAARRGCAPNRREAAARGTIRHAIHQLEKLKVVTKGKNGCAAAVRTCACVGVTRARAGVRSGRIVSKTGRRDLDRIASQLKNVKVRKPSPPPPHLGQNVLLLPV